MRHSIALLGVVALLASAASPGLGASPCAEELSALCAADSTSPEEFVRCARAKDDLLSPACQSQLAEARRPHEERRAKRRAAVRAACEADVERLCPGVRRKPKPVAQCLDRNRHDVSPACLRAASRFLARHAS